MTQDAERTSRDCPVCHATRGAMCTGPTGQTELEVHRERPYWSSSVRMMVLPHPAAAADPKAVQIGWHQHIVEEHESAEIERLRFRMPTLSQRNTDAEMLRWGQALARAERHD